MPRSAMRVPALSRRAALMLPLALAGCDTLEGWFTTSKPPLEGTRLPILGSARTLQVDNPPGRPVALPPPVDTPASPQAGGTPAHVGGHAAVRDPVAASWSASIGTGGGYRRKITARPVVADGRVFTMDSDAIVSAFEVATGNRLWRVPAVPDTVDSTNVGGGIALDGGTLYAATGVGEVLAMQAASGKILWRKPLPTAARAAPTVADGRLFVPTLDSQLIAFSAADGTRQWAYQGNAADAGLLGLPSPAYAGGLLVAGFESGDLVGLRADSGAVIWTESLASVHGRTSLVDLSAVRGMPVIADGRVYATSVGGVLICADLRTGRRLWERDVASQETPWLAGDWLFAITEDQTVAAFNRDDGAVAWIARLPRWQDPEKQADPIRWVGPILAGGRLFVTGSTGQVTSINPSTGKILGTEPLPAASSLAPVVAVKTVFLVLDDGTLATFR